MCSVCLTRNTSGRTTNPFRSWDLPWQTTERAKTVADRVRAGLFDPEQIQDFPSSSEMSAEDIVRRAYHILWLCQAAEPVDSELFTSRNVLPSKASLGQQSGIFLGPPVERRSIWSGLSHRSFCVLEEFWESHTQSNFEQWTTPTSRSKPATILRPRFLRHGAEPPKREEMLRFVEEAKQQGLVEEACFEDKLASLKFAGLKALMDRCGLQRKQSKTLCAKALAEYLSNDELHALTSQTLLLKASPTLEFEFWLRGYLGAPPSEYRRCIALQDSLRGQTRSKEEIASLTRYTDPIPSELRNLFTSALHQAISHPDYPHFLQGAYLPLELNIAERHAWEGNKDKVLEWLQKAIHSHKVYGDIESATGSKMLFFLIQALIRTHIEHWIQGESGDFPELKELEFEGLVYSALHKRISEDGATDFLISNHRQVFLGFGDCSKESENQLRAKRGVPRIGEGWASEAELLSCVRSVLKGRKVIHQYSPEWLGRQRIDIFVPSLSLAIEYQGIQHYEPVEFFGGLEGLRYRQKLDQRKAMLCRTNGVQLVHFRYDNPISTEAVRALINDVEHNT